MGRSASDEKILSYNDVVLRRSDLDILRGPYYLNDQIIEFYFSYLSSRYSSQDILLVPPSISFWITNCPDAASLEEFVQPLNFHGKALIIFPVNNNDDVKLAEGGSHWSLLAYYRDANIFVHHDSSGGINSRPARLLFKAVNQFVCVPNSSSGSTYQECTNSPQQDNGYDCGLYVIAIARAIFCWHASGVHKDPNDLWFSVIKDQVIPFVVAEMRKEILRLIESLMVTK